MNLDSLIEEVSKYSKSMPGLKKAHHFKFAKPHPDHSKRGTKFVVMGMNPGETDQDWKDHPKSLCEEVYEETLRYDFREGKKIANNSKKWRANITDICGTSDVFQTEAFFWSSGNVRRKFEEKFGAKAQCPCMRHHFEFCKSVNLKLIAKLNPNAVVAPGLGWSNFLASIYNLKSPTTVYCKEKPNHRLIIQFEDAKGLPWIFTKHWSGARGFSNSQKHVIANYIQNFA